MNTLSRCKLIGLICCILLVAACRQAPENESTDRPTKTPPVVTETIEPTSTPTSTPTPTEAPTKTPRPTFTVIPTNTPRGTATKAAPSATAPPTITLTETVSPTLVATVSATRRVTESVTAPLGMTVTLTSTKAVAQSANVSMSHAATLDEGTRVTLAGKVVNVRSFSKGFNFVLTDETGNITLLLWGNVYDALRSKGTLTIGAEVVVTGKVGRFQGDLQIEPATANALRITAPGYTAGQLVQGNQLDTHMDQRVMLEGNVSRSESNANGTKLFVNDGTGEVEVWIWGNIYERMDKSVATTGSRVRVVGIVSEFRGTPQLTPVLPIDIVIIN